jgi:hypothetical protein
MADHEHEVLKFYHKMQKKVRNDVEGHAGHFATLGQKYSGTA